MSRQNELMRHVIILELGFKRMKNIIQKDHHKISEIYQKKTKVPEIWVGLYFVYRNECVVRTNWGAFRNYLKLRNIRFKLLLSH